VTGNPLTGLNYFLQGVKLVRLPSLRRYVIVPLLVNIVLFVVLIALGITQFNALIEQLMPKLPDWLQWLTTLLEIFVIAGTLLVAFYTFSLVANLIAAPFNSALALAVERHLRGNVNEQRENSFASTLKEIGTSFLQQGKKLVYLITRAVPVLLLFLIPGVNIAAPFVWLLFGAWMLALEYLDYPMANHGLGFTDVRQQAKEHRLTTLGFGAAVMFVTLIPGLNLFVMPVAVAGATSLWVTERKESKQS